MSFFSSVGSLFGWGQSSSRSLNSFIPNYDDVCETRAMLRFFKLPDELILSILKHAEYWPQQTFKTSPEQRKRAYARPESPSDACLCLDAGIFSNPTVDPIRKGGEKAKVTSLTFEIDSYDQGFTSEHTHGTYETSSWTEVSILRSFDENNTHLPTPSYVNKWMSSPADFHKSFVSEGWHLVKRPENVGQGAQWGEGDFAWYLQGNLVAAPRSAVRPYKVVWTESGYEGNDGAGTGLGFLDELRDGDRILVWARARYPEWQCMVESIKLTVNYTF